MWTEWEERKAAAARCERWWNDPHGSDDDAVQVRFVFSPTWNSHLASEVPCSTKLNIINVSSIVYVVVSACVCVCVCRRDDDGGTRLFNRTFSYRWLFRCEWKTEQKQASHNGKGNSLTSCSCMCMCLSLCWVFKVIHIRLCCCGESHGKSQARLFYLVEIHTLLNPSCTIDSQCSRVISLEWFSSAVSKRETTQHHRRENSERRTMLVVVYVI